MLESSRVCRPDFTAAWRGWVVVTAAVLTLAACAAPEAGKPAEAAPEPTRVPAPPLEMPRATAEEARALLAQAETDIQRARTRRALWSKAWEALVAARASAAADDNAGAIRHARRASELAQLGLEQLAFPAVR